MGRLLEAAYGAFGAWFQATPPLAAGERLQVKYYADQTSWAAGLAANGVAAPSEAGGYYAPSTKTAYLFQQGNPYYSHVLLVHEATHQYHFLSRTKGQALPFWYAEGHAEYLSRHDWDDRCIRLGVIPMLSWEDMSAQALAEAKPPAVDVAALVAGTAPPDRPAAWAIFRYLDTGTQHDAFKLFRDAFDADLTDPAHSFAALVGAPAALSAPLDAWIAGAQEPMKPIFTEWIHVGPGAVIADSPGYFSLAIVKDPVTHFEARWDVPTAAILVGGRGARVPGRQELRGRRGVAGRQAAHLHRDGGLCPVERRRHRAGAGRQRGDNCGRLRRGRGGHGDGERGGVDAIHRHAAGERGARGQRYPRRLARRGVEVAAESEGPST